MKYRKKPVVVEATQWFKNGDHPEDACYDVSDGEGGTFLSEGKVVRYFRHPNIPGHQPCSKCGKAMHVHGWIDTLEDRHNVCPGDWIITGVKGERYPCKPDIFAATYDPSPESPAKEQPGERSDLVQVTRAFLQSVECPECDGSGWHTNTGPDPQHDPCAWCEARDRFLAGEVPLPPPPERP